MKCCLLAFNMKNQEPNGTSLTAIKEQDRKGRGYSSVRRGACYTEDTVSITVPTKTQQQNCQATMQACVTDPKDVKLKV